MVNIWNLQVYGKFLNLSEVYGEKTDYMKPTVQKNSSTLYLESSAKHDIRPLLS